MAKSSRFNCSVRGGTPFSPLSFPGDEAVSDDVGVIVAMVDGSTGPRICDFSKDSSRVPGGCMGSYSSVASCPARDRMAFVPPGWEERKSVTS